MNERDASHLQESQVILDNKLLQRQRLNRIER